MKNTFGLQILIALILFSVFACVDGSPLSRQNYDQWLLATYDGGIVVSGTRALNDSGSLFVLQRDSSDCYYYQVSIRMTATNDTPVLRRYAKFRARIDIDGQVINLDSMASVYKQAAGKVHHFELSVEKLTLAYQQLLPRMLAYGKSLKVQIYYDSGFAPIFEFSLSGSQKALQQQEHLCFSLTANNHLSR